MSDDEITMSRPPRREPPYDDEHGPKVQRTEVEELVAFLTAQLDELAASTTEAFTLADVDAKRQIVEAMDDLVREHDNTICNDDYAAGQYTGRATFYRLEVLRLLALPFADRPGYRTEWRP